MRCLGIRLGLLVGVMLVAGCAKGVSDRRLDGGRRDGPGISDGDGAGPTPDASTCTGGQSPATEVCDGKDNDCDGKTDENLTRSCYTGPPATENVGQCKAGTETCVTGSWSTCSDQVLPAPECCDGKDNDCDGNSDEDLTQSCYGGPTATRGVGDCKAGTQTCSAGSWGGCTGEVLPAAEVCDNHDNNCDGKIDDGVTKSCYTGPLGTEGVGECKAGTATCSAGIWTGCTGQQLPLTETCDGKDNDCNGQTDELCGCAHGVCTAGNPLLATCGSITAAVCAADSYCCTYKWDASCVGQVRTEALSLACSEAQGGCAHSLCVTGAKLASGCDSAKANCVAAICAADSYCCNTSWDTVCVGRVSSTCGKNCHTN